MYASADDIAELYGQDLLAAVGTRGDALDQAAVDTALETASSEIDSYLAARYYVPLDPAPAYIRQICVDIAVYRLAQDEAPRTTEMRQRYDDAIRYLTTVSKGLANVETGGGTGGDGETPPTTEVGSKAGVRSAVRC